MTRDELIDAAMEAAQSIPNPVRPLFDEDDEAQVEAVVDAVEPLIRADEREQMPPRIRPQAIRADERATLRAKVEALETFHNMVWKQDVLALIDEADP